jgi:hypothetical protein
MWEFGAFDQRGTDDAKWSPALIDALIMTLNRVKSILFFYLPMNASSFVDSHFLFRKKKLDLAVYG